jgi:acid stress chaperone HdeB
MKRLACLALAALAACGGSVRAQQLDLAAVTCKEFQASDKETVSLVLMWLQAYYTEPNAKPIVDLDKMKADGAKIADYCGKNPNHSVIIAADDVLGK